MPPMPERSAPLVVVCGEALIDLFVDLGRRRDTQRRPSARRRALQPRRRAGAHGAARGALRWHLDRHVRRGPAPRARSAEGVSGAFLERLRRADHAGGDRPHGRPAGRPTSSPSKSAPTGNWPAAASTSRTPPVGTLVLGSHLLVLPETQERLLRIVKADRTRHAHLPRPQHPARRHSRRPALARGARDVSALCRSGEGERRGHCRALSRTLRRSTTSPGPGGARGQARGRDAGRRRRHRLVRRSGAPARVRGGGPGG